MSIAANDLSRLHPATRQFLDTPGRVLIAGEWVASSGSIDVVDPSSEATVAAIAAADEAAVDAAVRSAVDAFGGAWSRTASAERERLLLKWADLIEANARILAELETVDVGMPIWMARRNDVEGTLATLRYMAGWATKIAGEAADIRLPIPDSSFLGYTLREPVGVVGAIIPWNVPLMLAMWKLAPALAAGCTVVLKPSEEASLSVLFLCELARQAGFPPGVVNVVTGTGAVVGEALVRHPDVDKITFTGSTATGVRIATAAAASVKKVSLELGGKSPQLVFADADLNACIPRIADSIFLNSGQICVAGSRLYVERARHDEIVERLAAHIRSLKIGAGLDPETRIGPLINGRQKANVTKMLEEASREGACVTQESLPGGPGYFVAPGLVTSVDQSMQIVREEVFGPVLAITAFEDTDEAVSFANDTRYGLSACVWTHSLAKAHRVAARIRSGKVAVNTDPIPAPSMPEGGRKASGYGRDQGFEAVAGYLETKSVLVRLD